MMRILVDADACPNTIKSILFKASERVGFELILVANHYISTPRQPKIHLVIVEQGFDVADRYIADVVQKTDLVITADIPLADSVITKGAQALNPRGELYTQENIKQRLQMRNFMESLRESGANTGGPEALNGKDVQKFANALDRFITQNK